MIRVLGISGSPVAGSSTELIVHEVLKGAVNAGAETDFIYLNELDIMPCQACGQSPEEGYCFFSDGMDEIYKKFDECDAIVIGSPIYFDSVSAQTKLFIDRTNCFRTIDSKKPGVYEPRFTKKRKGLIVLVGGERDIFEFARRVIGGFFVWAGIANQGVIAWSGTGFDKGGVARDSELLAEAFAAGEQLAKSGLTGRCTTVKNWQNKKPPASCRRLFS